MPFLVHIFADGKRKRVDEGDVQMSPINSRATTTNTTTTSNTSATCTDYRKNHSKDTGNEGEGGRSLLNGAVEDGETGPMPLLEAVNFLDSKIGSTTTEKETKSQHDTRNSSSNEQVIPKRSKTRAIISFEERCEKLLLFKEEFGHCNVPQRDPSLGLWCKTTRSAYTRMQQGKNPKMILSQDRIERLEAIGFQWRLIDIDYDEAFEQRCCDLEAFKSEFGHCDVPYHYSADPSLGKWCSNIRFAYTQTQQGQKPRMNLCQDRIERLDKIGFKWKGRVIGTDEQKTFEQRCRDLEAFKSEFGHCNVPMEYAADPSLGNWGNKMRCAYTQIQRGLRPDYKLSEDQIERLEAIGVIWSTTDKSKAFEQRCYALEAFKSEFGHYDVPYTYSADPSLGKWCAKIRTTYNQMQKGKPTTRIIPQYRIDRLNEIDFDWGGFDYEQIFEQHCRDLEAFKSEFGHCNVPCKYSADPTLGRWCSAMRDTYRLIQQGKKPNRNLSKTRIERLEGVGFHWTTGDRKKS
jgi:hypothetical protein